MGGSVYADTGRSLTRRSSALIAVDNEPRRVSKAAAAGGVGQELPAGDRARLLYSTYADLTAPARWSSQTHLHIKRFALLLSTSPQLPPHKAQPLAFF